MVAARSVLRVLLGVFVFLSAGIVVSGYATHSPADTVPEPNATESGAASADGTGNRSPSSSASTSVSGVTVVTTDSNRLLLGLANDSRAEAEIVAYDRDGSVRYYNNTHDRYWDVDPVVENEADETGGTDRIDGINGSEGADGTDGTERAGRIDEPNGTDRAVETTDAGSMTVEYVASDRLNASVCASEGRDDGANAGGDVDGVDETDDGTDEGEGNASEDGDREEEAVCARNVIERVNLSTGEVTPIYEEVALREDFAPWNDADRINDTHYVVADRTENRVFIVDTRTGEYVWEWYAASAFPFDSGGRYIDDWTHMNDVEYLADGRIMASLRNHDQVIFLDPDRSPERAVLEGWTLGADDNYTTLYEQYNPDYIPPENGGPAVLVADAENSRVVEYARRNGSWEQVWTWEDATLQWPRDADRLPNGHTLVVDSNGDRVVEVDDAGEVVWNVSVGLPYDAERLGTGPESAGGPSTDRIAARTNEGDESDAVNGGDDSEDDTDRGDPLVAPIKRLLPGPALSAMLYFSPDWMGVTELLGLCVLCIVSLGWFLAELRWRSVFADLRAWAEESDRR